MKTIQMFENYPKVRSILPEAYVEIYKEQYKTNREGGSTASSLSQKLESWLHCKVASDVSPVHDKKTLEIGAGTLNQLQYEVSSCYDIVEPFKELYEHSDALPKIRNIYTDMAEVEPEQKYDRITSVAVFEHIADLPKVVALSCLSLNEGGALRTSIPNEGSFLWKLGWQLTTGLEFKIKHGLDYEVLMKHEHINTADEIEEILSYFFEVNRCSCFGLGRTFSFYRFYESKQPRLDRARAYLGLT